MNNVWWCIERITAREENRLVEGPSEDDERENDKTLNDFNKWKVPRIQGRHAFYFFFFLIFQVIFKCLLSKGG